MEILMILVTDKMKMYQNLGKLEKTKKFLILTNLSDNFKSY